MRVLITGAGGQLGRELREDVQPLVEVVDVVHEPERADPADASRRGAAPLETRRSAGGRDRSRTERHFVNRVISSVAC